MFAKRFFYASAGITCLAVAFCLGALVASAQVPGTIVAAGAASGFNAVVGRTVYTMTYGDVPITRPPVPGSDAIIAVDGNGSGNQVLLANGDAYIFVPAGSPGGWVYKGNLFGGAAPVQRGTFGAIKSRYRAQPGSR